MRTSRPIYELPKFEISDTCISVSLRARINPNSLKRPHGWPLYELLSIFNHLQTFGLFQNVFSLYFSDRKYNEILNENFQFFETLSVFWPCGYMGYPHWSLLSHFKSLIDTETNKKNIRIRVTKLVTLLCLLFLTARPFTLRETSELNKW